MFAALMLVGLASIGAHQSKPATTTNAASGRYHGTADSIAAIYGNGFADYAEEATSLPLPKTLANVTVFFDGAPVGLFYVSPTQINFHVPKKAREGHGRIIIANTNGATFESSFHITRLAPGVFTYGNQGIAAADYGDGYVSLYVTGAPGDAVAWDTISLHTEDGDYPACYFGESEFVGCQQINFLDVPIKGQVAILNVGSAQSNGFILMK
jgi:uncharacterized protein (TIGR03437 family)